VALGVSHHTNKNFIAKVVSTGG
jgi:hypothetical protein